MSVANIFNSQDLPGECLLTPLKFYHSHVMKQIDKSSGWRKTAFITSHLALALFAYPLFGLIAVVGMGVKTWSIRSLLEHNQQQINAIGNDSKQVDIVLRTRTKNKFIHCYPEDLPAQVAIYNSTFQKIYLIKGANWGFPPEITDLVFSFLNPSDLIKIRQVCKTWNIHIIQKKCYELQTTLNRAKAETLKVQDSFCKDQLLLSIIKIEAQHNLPEAQKTAGLIKESFFKAQALCKIAKIDPSHDLSPAREITGSIQDPESRAIILTLIAKIDPSHDLSPAKKATSQMENNYNRNKRLSIIARIEADYDPQKAKETALTIQEPERCRESYLKIKTLLSIADIDQDLSTVKEIVDQIADPSWKTEAQQEIEKKQPQWKKSSATSQTSKKTTKEPLHLRIESSGGNFWKVRNLIDNANKLSTQMRKL